MKQLLLKDLYTQRLFGYTFPLFFLMPFYVSSLNGVNYSVIYITYSAVWLSIFSNFGTTASNRLELGLLSSLPITRKNLVQAKYYAAFIWWGIGFIIYGTIAILISMFLGNTLNWEYIPSLVLSLSATLIIISIFYPLYFLVGYQIAAGITMVFPLMAFFVVNIQSMDGELISLQIFQTNNLLFCLLLLVASMIITFLSYMITIKIYEKKDL